MGRRQAFDRDHPRSLTNACSTAIHILLLFRSALRDALLNIRVLEEPSVYRRPPATPGNSVQSSRALLILWSNLVWIVLLCLSVLWLTLFNLFQGNLLGTGPMWSRYVSSPFRVFDGVAIIAIIGWLLNSLFNCRSKQGLQRRTLVVIGYTLYVLVTSPIPSGLMNYIGTGCWSDKC